MYTFQSTGGSSAASAADAYLESDLARGLMDTDGFENFQVRGFDVLSELSALTGVAGLAPLLAV